MYVAAAAEIWSLWLNLNKSQRCWSADSKAQLNKSSMVSSCSLFDNVNILCI